MDENNENVQIREIYQLGPTSERSENNSLLQVSQNKVVLHINQFIG